LAFITIGFISIYLISANPQAFESHRYQQMVGTVETLERYLSSESTYDDSIGIRKKLIANGLDALVDSYGIGVGGGGSIAVQEEQGGLAGKYKSMHNFWIEMLVDSGVVFTLAFIAWYISVTLKLFQISKRSKGDFAYYSRSLFISMVGFTLAAVSASSVIYFLPMWLMYGLSIATIANYEREKARWYKRKASRIRGTIYRR
jgi:teichuronic acid biosynthesis protein TuaE